MLGSKTEKILCLMIYETDSEISNLLVCKDPEHDMLVVGKTQGEVSSSLDKKKNLNSGNPFLDSVTGRF